MIQFQMMQLSMQVMFCSNMIKSTYTEFVGNVTGNIFLVTSRDHEFLLSHKGNVSNVSSNSDVSAKSHFVKNFINLSQRTFPIPSDP